MSLPLDPKVLLFLSLCDVQLTSLITWWAATAPDQARSTSSSPQWRKPQKGCWPAAPTISSPSSPMTTKTITCLGNGASLSRRIGRTDFFDFFFPPSHTRSLVHQCLPLLCFRFSFFLAIIPTSPWILDCFSLLLSPSISLLTPLLRFHLFSFSSKFQSLHHSSHSNADWFLFAPAFITRMTS